MKQVSIQRAEEIILTRNPKFNWFYEIKTYPNYQEIVFYCENCYRKYVLEFDYSERAIALMSYIVGLMNDLGFNKKGEKVDKKVFVYC